MNMDTGKLEKVDDFQVPEVLKPNIRELSNYRNDISSTELRNKQLLLEV